MIDIFRRKNKHITAGIEISDERVSLLVHDSKDAKNRKIKKYISYELSPKNTLEDTINDLRKSIKECGVKQLPCCYVLNEKDYELFQIEALNVPDDELVEAIRWKVKDLISYDLEEAEVDVFFQPESGGQKMLYAAVARKEAIKKRSLIIEQCDLNLVAVDIPELSYRNFIEQTEYSDKSVALVVLGLGTGKLIVINRSEVCFTRSFPLSYSAGLFDDIPENDLILELQRSLDYYEHQLKQEVPSDILVCGENVIEEKITDAMRNSFNQSITTHFLDIDDLSEKDHVMGHVFMRTYGAALRKGMLV